MDHRAFGILLSATFGDLPSVDASGQLDVRDENVADPPPVPRQRFFAVSHMDDLVLFFSQSLPPRRLASRKSRENQGMNACVVAAT